MADGDFFWIYLIFFAIPLARIIPRVIRKWQNKDKFTPQTQHNQDFQKPLQERNERRDTFENVKSFDSQESFETSEPFEKPMEKDMQILGEINKGIKDFNEIQKNVKINNNELEKILKDFEDEGLMRVIKKDGVMGSKIELHPTEKGYRKFNK